MSSDVTDEREFLLRSLRDLDAERAAGDISDDDYRALKDDYTARAAAALRRPRRVGDAETAALTRPGRVVAGVMAVVLLAVGAGWAVAAASGERVAGQPSSGSIATGPSDDLARAQELVGEGKAVEAVKLYDKVLQEDPRNPEALAYRGWLVRLAGLSDEGLKYVDRAIEADPSYPDAHFFRGMILWKDKHQPADGAAELRLFLGMNPPEEMVPMVRGALEQAEAESRK